VLGDMRDGMDRQDEKLANLWRWNGPRRNRRNRGGSEDDDFGRENRGETEEEYNFMTGRNRHRGDRRERNHRRFDCRDGSLNTKMKTPSFQRRKNHEIYLEWEKKMKFIFDCHNCSYAKKVKLVVIDFTNYVIVWWDKLVLSRKRDGVENQNSLVISLSTVGYFQSVGNYNEIIHY